MLNTSGMSFLFVTLAEGCLCYLCCRDRRKLTFYFVADKRIDFRELVRELFRFVCPSSSTSVQSLRTFLLACTKQESGWLPFKEAADTNHNVLN